MSNVLVLTIISCIGVATGVSVFITTSKTSLAYNTTSDKNEELKPNEVNLTTVDTGRGKELPSNRKNIDETALYEDASAKQNNQSERAFIYINQKYRKPSLHHYFRLGETRPEFMRRFSMAQALPYDIMLHRHYEPCKSEPAKVRSYFQEYDFPGRLPDIGSYYVGPKLYNNNCTKSRNLPPVDKQYNHKTDNHNEPIARIQNYNIYKTYNHNNKKVNPQRDYIELLKSPLLRPPNRPSKPKYEGNPNYPTPLNYKDLLNAHNSNNQYNSKDLVEEHKLKGRYQYGFSPFSYPSYQSKRRLQLVEVPNTDKDLPKDEEYNHALDATQDEDKLLDQYLKETLEDQVTSKEIGAVTNDCKYHECNSKSSSNTGHQKDNKKLDCKCGWQKPNPKDSLTPKERPERDEVKCNQTNSNKPSEITYYEEILTEDSTNKKPSSDLKLISKLNSTYH